MSAAGTVPELLVENPLSDDVLLYDGEELVGAKQNRILNVTVLVAARTTLRIPVSCVEAGRWRTETAEFSPAPHAAHPRLRRRKAEALASEPLARGIAQDAVWDEVQLAAHRLDVQSPTRANADAFRTHRASLAELEARFPLEPGQCGAVLAIGGDACLDVVSRPDAFAHLWPKLRAGYLLDTLDRLDGPAGPDDAAASLLAAVDAADRTRRPSAGLGVDVRLLGADIIGGGLEHGGELVQLSAFRRAAADTQTPTRAASIAGPAARHRWASRPASPHDHG